MKNKKIKIVGSILGVLMYIISYKTEYKGIINNDLPNNSFTTTATQEANNKKEFLINPTNEQTISQDNQEVFLIEKTEEKEIENLAETNGNINDLDSQIETITNEITKNLLESNTSKNIEDKSCIVGEIATIKNETNMYSSNTKESLKIANLQIDDLAFKILSCENNWVLVKSNNQIGYVCEDDLENSYETYIEENSYVPKKDIVITTTDLNFRTNPSIDSEIITTLLPKTELEVIALVSDDWLLVKNKAQIGYVYKDYTISLLEEVRNQYPELNIDDLKPEKIIYSKTNLNIRNYYNTDSDIIGCLEKYESGRVLEEYDDWYFIMTNEYQFGFVNKEYTEELDDLYVIVDVSKQRLYMYYNNELCYIARVTTGKNSTPSDIGLFKIWYKGTDEEIAPGAFVHYWMVYNSSYEGLHDADLWRDEYGITIEDNKNNNYTTNGSNGCVNMPFEAAKLIYQNVSIGTKVLVHK